MKRLLTVFALLIFIIAIPAGADPLPPTIDSFTPTSGPVGTTVTITGTGFTGSDVVFNGTTATNSATRLTTTVPAGATTGPITVTTPNGIAASASSFTVIPSPPTVDSFAPTSGLVGSSVTVTGTSFTETSNVSFNGTAAPFTVDSDTQISTSVPTGATTGPISVINPGGTGTSATSFTVTVPPPPPPTCTGVQVPAGANLNTVIPNGQAQTYCLAAGTYELGTASLGYDSGDVIVGQPVTFGPNGGVSAPTAIHSTAVLGVIKGLSGKPTLTLDSLDICCSSNSGSNGQRGRGINGGGGLLVNLTVRNSRIHGNGINGIGAVGMGLVVENTEIDHNGAAGGDGISAGIKVINYAEIRNSYIHDNNNNGMWWDCDAPGGVIEDSIITANSRSGVFIEISSGDASSGKSIPPGATYGFKVLNNTFDGNNPSGAAIHSGILVESARNATVDGNASTNNLQYNIHVLNDSRQNKGHNGCSSGFTVSNVTVQNNQYGPANIQGCSLGGVTCLNNTKIL